MGLLISATQPDGEQERLIFDCSYSLTNPPGGVQQHTEAHIPEAQYIALDRDLIAKPDSEGRHPLPEREILGEKLRERGTNKNSTIVCYDQNTGAYVTRMWWILRWLDHDDVYVLDGWKAVGLPTETITRRTEPGNFTAKDPLTRIWKTENLTDADSKLIDAREVERFLGIEETVDRVAGHIPGALFAAFIDNFKGRYFRFSEELRLRFTDLLSGRAMTDKIICYCDSGVTATHNIFALMHTGFDEPALYPGSWSHWITDPKRPIATGQ